MDGESGESGESGRSPYGERGLKYIGDLVRGEPIGSLSLRRAWIEMLPVVGKPSGLGRSPYGERGLKCKWATTYTPYHVALLTESVD